MKPNQALVVIPLLFAVPPTAATELMRESFTMANGLITNEYAFWNPNNPSAVISPTWELDSGSFFAQANQGWTGVPDDTPPNATSSNGTNSSVFRLTTKRADFGDVAVSFSLLNQGLSTSPSTPAVDWDGLHIFLRYQTEYNLYYTSINRRDNTVIIKKKIPGGPSNGGTYYELTPYVPFQVPYNTWQSIKATVKNNSNNTVTIQLFQGNTLLVSATDDGTLGGPPITHAGKVGLRGDNANLKMDDFVVETFGTAPPPPPLPTPTPNPTPKPNPTPTPPPSAPTTAPAKRSQILNRANGDREVVLLCDDGSPVIFARSGQMIRQSLPQIAPSQYSWNGLSDTGEMPATGTYHEKCGSKFHALVLIH